MNSLQNATGLQLLRDLDSYRLTMCAL